MNTGKKGTLGYLASSLFEREEPMGYRLVIAEKPSVAQSIAKVIGADRRQDGNLEENGYLVSWCVRHLVELCEPQDYDPILRALSGNLFSIQHKRYSYIF